MDSVQDVVQRLLLFSIGGGLYATHVSFIREIVADQKKVPLPNVPDYIPGVINLRNEVVKVIDIRKIIPLDVEFIQNGSDGMKIRRPFRRVPVNLFYTGCRRRSGPSIIMHWSLR